MPPLASSYLLVQNLIIIICTPLVSHSHARYPTSRQTVSRTAIRAEIDFDAEIKKLQTEAEERLDEKVEELMKNIDTVGQD